MTNSSLLSSRGGVGLSKVSPVIDDVYPPAAGLEPALVLLRKMGISHLELRSIPVQNGYEAILAVADEDLDRLQRLLEKYAIRVAGLAVSLFKCPLRGTVGPVWGGHHHMDANVGYEHYLDALPRAFAMADRFGTGNIRCFAFWREYPFEEVFAEVVDKLGRAAEIARAAGHKLYLENEMNTMAGTGVELGRILKAVNSPSLVGIYDDGNSTRVGGVPYPDDYEALRGWLGHVHIKHRRINVMCGWMTPGYFPYDRSGEFPPYVPSDHSPQFLWHQPTAPISGEITIGGKAFPIAGSQTVETVYHSAVDYYRSWFRSLRKDGYDGIFAIDNTWESPTRRATIVEKEAAIELEIDTFGRMLDEIWAEESPYVTTR